MNFDPRVSGSQGKLEIVKDYWNQRAALGERAGSDDLIAKELEQRAILSELPKAYRPCVLEVGCGRGETAQLVAARLNPVVFDAVDASEAMIAAANEGNAHQVTFQRLDVEHLPRGPYDIAYSQRCLINLSDWDAQKRAIDAVAERLVSGGLFLMLENSQDGLNVINYWRGQVGLPPIERPWHNRYLYGLEIATVTSLKLLRCVPFSAAYYFLSRVVNAKLAHEAGLAPAYDSTVNRLALSLDAETVSPRFAQGRLWVWQKA